MRTVNVVRVKYEHSSNRQAVASQMSSHVDINLESVH